MNLNVDLHGRLKSPFWSLFLRSLSFTTSYLLFDFLRCYLDLKLPYFIWHFDKSIGILRTPCICGDCRAGAFFAEENIHWVYEVVARYVRRAYGSPDRIVFHPSRCVLRYVPLRVADYVALRSSPWSNVLTRSLPVFNTANVGLNIKRIWKIRRISAERISLILKI